MRRAELPPVLRGTIFTTAQAAEAGVPVQRLRASDLVSPFRSVHVPNAVPLDLVGRAAALMHRLPEGAAFSHETAAALVGAPLPFGMPLAELHVTRTSRDRALDADGVVGHVVSDELLRHEHVAVADSSGTVHMLRIVRPTLLVAGLASRLGVDDLVPVIDWLIDERAPRLVLADLDALVVAWGRRAGAAVLRQAVPLARTGSRSRPETQKRMLMVRAGLPEPELNVPILAADGSLIGYGDAVFRRYRVVSEFEGDWHRTDPRKFRSDISRFERYADAGWSALRVTSRDLYGDPNPYLGRLARRLAAAGCPIDPAGLVRQPPFRR